MLEYPKKEYSIARMASRHPEGYKELLVRLRDARMHAGMNQEDVASAFGVRQTQISKIELGERRIDPVELVEFADLYGQPVAYFLDGITLDTSREADHGTITEVLGQWAAGDAEALTHLMPLVYDDLKAACRKAFSREAPGHLLQPTALVNEVYLRLAQVKVMSWEDRGAFFSFAALLMRRILVDHAREVKAKKRGGSEERVTLDLSQVPDATPTVDPLDLDRALDEIEKHDPQIVQIIHLRYFVGLSQAQIAEQLGISRSAVQREWKHAKRLLAQALGG